MALICVNGAKECCGCGGCRVSSDERESICVLCRSEIESGEVYSDAFYETLCLACLKALHKL